MKIIFVRSPYFIEVDEASQVESKIELFIWRKGETEPATATYTLSKKAASATQTKNIYNISNYVKEFIDIISPVLVTTPTEEENNNWCYVKVKRYYSTTPNNASPTLLDTTTYISTNGYTNYLDGYNNLNEADELVLTSLQNKKYKYYFNNVPYINFLIDIGSDEYQISLKDLNGDNEEIINIIDTPTEEYLFKLPITNLGNEFFSNGNIFEILKNSESIFTTTFISECENKYEPLQCSFINRMGGWEFLTFFKARTQQWEVKNKEYQLLPNDVDYNPLRGESKAFNYEAKQSIKINTGWVEEHYNELIKDLMTSETILLDNKPVKLKTMTTDLKTSLQDKMINYQIDFEYNYNQINNVI
jgi:hypothetical protein